MWKHLLLIWSILSWQWIVGRYGGIKETGSGYSTVRVSRQYAFWFCFADEVAFKQSAAVSALAELLVCHRHPCAGTNRLAYRRDFMFLTSFQDVTFPCMKFKLKVNGLLWLSVLCRTFLVSGTHVPGPTVWPTGAILCLWPRFRTSNSLEWSSNSKVMRCFD